MAHAGQIRSDQRVCKNPMRKVESGWRIVKSPALIGLWPFHKTPPQAQRGDSRVAQSRPKVLSPGRSPIRRKMRASALVRTTRPTPPVRHKHEAELASGEAELASREAELVSREAELAPREAELASLSHAHPRRGTHAYMHTQASRLRPCMHTHTHAHPRACMRMHVCIHMPQSREASRCPSIPIAPFYSYSYYVVLLTPISKLPRGTSTRMYIHTCAPACACACVCMCTRV